MNFYNPYPYQYPPQPRNDYLPQQQVLQANGKDSVAALKLAPNSSVLIMDTTAPLVWLCVSDSLGNVTSTPYDIAPHQEKAPVDVATVEQRLASAEEKIEKLMEAINNGKPDAEHAD